MYTESVKNQHAGVKNLPIGVTLLSIKIILTENWEPGWNKTVKIPEGKQLIFELSSMISHLKVMWELEEKSCCHRGGLEWFDFLDLPPVDLKSFWVE